MENKQQAIDLLREKIHISIQNFLPKSVLIKPSQPNTVFEFNLSNMRTSHNEMLKGAETAKG